MEGDRDIEVRGLATFFVKYYCEAVNEQRGRRRDRDIQVGGSRNEGRSRHSGTLGGGSIIKVFRVILL